MITYDVWHFHTSDSSPAIVALDMPYPQAYWHMCNSFEADMRGHNGAAIASTRDNTRCIAVIADTTGVWSFGYYLIPSSEREIHAPHAIRASEVQP